jgi:hypothetical protein
MADTTPTTEPVVTPLPADPAALPPPPELSPTLKALAELGFENVKDESEGLQRLLASHKQLKTEFSAQLQGALAEFKQSQPTNEFAAPVHEAPKPSGSEFAFQVPKIDKSEVARWRTADGWKEGTPEAIKQQYAGYTQARDRFAENLLDDFEATVNPLIDQRVEQRVEQRLNHVAQLQQQQTYQQKLFADNAWLFENDPVSGKPSRALSAEGKLIDQYMQEAQARGADYELSWEFALSKHSASKAAQTAKQTATAQTAAEINEQKKRESLLRGGGTPSRTGSMPTPAEPRVSQNNKAMTPGRRFAQIASREGLPLNN